jgi:peptidoglycan hydrolase-like protein with peptidoglycan-binding domain
MAMGINPGSIDGVFGPKTEAAVKQCQERCGVTADGIWGPGSQAAFDKKKAEMMNPTKAADKPEADPTCKISRRH